MQWTPELDSALAQLWGEGLSGSQIAKRIGAVSRCSTLARARRIGLPPRVSEESKSSTRPPRKAPRFNLATTATKSKSRPVLSSEPYVARETVVTPAEQRLSFDDIVDGRCKYAHGDTPPYSFCGAKSAAPGGSWCETHMHAVFGTKPVGEVFTDASKNPEPENTEKSRVLEAVL